MNDQELIRALRKTAMVITAETIGFDDLKLNAACRLEALLAENEAMKERDEAYKKLKQALERKCTAMEYAIDHLREVTKIVPRYVRPIGRYRR